VTGSGHDVALRQRRACSWCYPGERRRLSASTRWPPSPARGGGAGGADEAGASVGGFAAGLVWTVGVRGAAWGVRVVGLASVGVPGARETAAGWTTWAVPPVGAQQVAFHRRACMECCFPPVWTIGALEAALDVHPFSLAQSKWPPALLRRKLISTARVDVVARRHRDWPGTRPHRRMRRRSVGGRAGRRRAGRGVGSGARRQRLGEASAAGRGVSGWARRRRLGGASAAGRRPRGGASATGEATTTRRAEHAPTDRVSRSTRVQKSCGERPQQVIEPVCRPATWSSRPGWSRLAFRCGRSGSGGAG
jgi:hypothetical protein